MLKCRQTLVPIGRDDAAAEISLEREGTVHAIRDSS